MENPLYSDWPELVAHCEETHNTYNSSRFPSCSVLLGGVTEEDGSSAASSVSKNHCLAEKRRRDRINVQLARLRNLIPLSDKMDKAALLGSVVEQLKDLREKAKEASKVVTVPSDFDEVDINCFLNQDESSACNSKATENIFIRVSICCDDRPDLFAELTQVFENLRLTITGVDMACLGGRIKSVMTLSAQNGVCISNTIQSLKGKLSRIASFSARPNCNHSRSKRLRFFCTGQ